jgi:hypothetical protein
MTRAVQLTSTADRLFQRQLKDAKRTVDRLNKARATEAGAALIRQAEDNEST